MKSKIYQHMTSVSKNVYTDKLVKIVDKYNNTYQKTMKIKPVDIYPGLYIDYCVEHIEKGSKFKVCDQVRI